MSTYASPLTAPRIGILTPWPLGNGTGWSGVIDPMVREITERFPDAVLINPSQNTSASDRAAARLLGLAGRTHLPDWSWPTALSRAEHVRRAVESSGVETLIVLAGTPLLLRLPKSIRVIQVTDSSFDALASTYPAFAQVPGGVRAMARQIERACAARTERFLVASDWSRDRLVADVGVDARSIMVAPFGPATPVHADLAERQSGDEMLRMLFVSSDWKRKGGDTAVEIARVLRCRGLGVELSVVGDVPENIPPWVHRLGRLDREAMSHAYRDHDVLLEPSRASAGGVVITDALHHGLPVLSTDIGGISTLVAHGKNGWLVPPNAHVDAYADTVAAFAIGRSLDDVRRAAVEDADQRLSWQAWGEALAREVLAPMAAPHSQRSPQRTLVISPSPPVKKPTHAGGVLLTRTIESYLQQGDQVVTFIPDSDAYREELRSRGQAGEVMLLGRPRSHSWLKRLVLTAVHRMQFTLSRLCGELPWLATCLDILLNPRARALVRTADHIDLQWEQHLILVPLLRALNRDVHITCMLHDVLDQVLTRRLDTADSTVARRRARRHCRWNRLIERRLLPKLDRVLVLSEKDAKIVKRITTKAKVSVVPAPLVDDSVPLVSVAGRPPVLGLVAALNRAENQIAVRRLVERVWPRVHSRVPKAVLHIVGGGAPQSLRDLLEASEAVNPLGFVEDLEAAYSELRAVLVPLETGAGVKFKVVEALVRGIPVVTTSVGAEGIGDSTWFAGLSEDDDELAEAAIAALTDDSAACNALITAKKARTTYGVSVFNERHAMLTRASRL